MTEERLEELIKQEAEIYVVENKNIFKYRLEYKLSRPRISIDALWLDICHIPYDYQFNQIFETETEAEKELERQIWKEKVTAERTERFEPPMWEDIEDNYEFYFTCQDYKSKSSNPCGMFVVNKKGTLKNYILVRNVSHYPNIFTFDEPATKENYERACEIVRDLFGGEK